MDNNAPLSTSISTFLSQNGHEKSWCTRLHVDAFNARLYDTVFNVIDLNKHFEKLRNLS